jgi:FkbM family methyltransferase
VPEGVLILSDAENSLKSAVVNWAATYATPRNIGHYFGRTMMEVAIEMQWARQRRAGDLTAIIPDHFVREGSTVVDVGASWGLFTYHLARQVGENGVLYSYEPHPANSVVLRKLAKAKPYVRFRAAALSNATGSAEMLVPRHRNRIVTAQSSLAHGFEGQAGVVIDKITVPTLRLDDEIDSVTRVDFIKIDVEGHEIAVLQGGAATIRRCMPPILIEIEQRHLDVSIENVFKEITGMGYHLFYIDGSVLRPIGQFDLQHNQLSKVVENQFNAFSMPKDYVCNFCAVATLDSLNGLPVAERDRRPSA